MVFDAHLTRAGIFEYQDSRGNVTRELREPEEVFRPDSMVSFQMVPVTDDHPPVGLLNAKNARTHMVGSTGDSIIRDDDHLRSQVMVTDAATIQKMKAGKVEVSCGYSCDVDDTPGEHPLYGKYDARQINIRGNHVAIVDSARAGHTARVRLDNAATQIINPPSVKKEIGMADKDDKNPDTKTIRALGAQLTEAKERADSADNKLKIETTRADVAEGKLLAADARILDLSAQLAANASAMESEAVLREKTRADSAESKVARFDATMEKRVRQRAKLEREAAAVLGADFRMDDLVDRDIRTQVVRRLDSSADVGKHVADGVIEGRFMSLVDGFMKNAESQARVADLLADGDKGTPRADAKTSRKDNVRNQWKQPLPNDIRADRSGKGA